MQNSRIRLVAAVVCCLLGFPVACAFGQALPDSQIVEDARTAYYNLHDQGLTEFRCDVRVDWNAPLPSQNGETARSGELLPLLRQTHFEALVGAGSAPRVSLEFDGAASRSERGRRAVAERRVARIIVGSLRIASAAGSGLPS